MSRFYQSGSPDFVENFMYTPPWELAQQALAYNDTGIGKTIEAASLFGNIDVNYIPDPVEKANVERDLKKYSDKAEEYSTNMQLQLQNSPQSWKKYMPQLQTLGTDLSKDMKTGNLAKYQQSAAALAKWQEENKKVKEENPELYERGLSHYVNEWRKNPNRSLDAVFSGNQLVNFDITSKEYLDALGDFKASLQQTENGMYIRNNEVVSEKEIEEAYLGLALSSPKGKAYLQQMAEFKTPGFYDPKTGKPEPIYVAKDIYGNQIPLENLKEQQQNWYKLSDGMKNKTPFPTEHLNPNHAWSGAIEAAKNIFGYSKVTNIEDLVKAAAMDRQHDFAMEKTKHDYRMSEKGQDHANKMLQLEKLAQMKGNQSPAGIANGAAKADALTAEEIRKSLDADQKDGKGGKVGMSGNLTDLRRLKNSGGADAINAQRALDRTIAETMQDLGYNVKFNKSGESISGAYLDRIAYDEFRKVFYSSVPDTKKSGVAATNIENRLLKEGLVEKKGNYIAATKKGIERGLKPSNPNFSQTVASYEMPFGSTHKNVLAYNNYIGKLTPITNNGIIELMSKKIEGNYDLAVQQAPIQFSSGGSERVSSTVNNGRENFTYRTQDGEALDPQTVRKVIATEGVYAPVIDFKKGRDIEGAKAKVYLKDDRVLDNVTIVGNSDNAWGGSLFGDEKMFDPAMVPLAKKIKESKLQNDIEGQAQRFIGKGENSSQRLTVFNNKEPLDYFVENDPTKGLLYYFYDKDIHSKTGHFYDNSEDFTRALLEYQKTPKTENIY